MNESLWAWLEPGVSPESPFRNRRHPARPLPKPDREYQKSRSGPIATRLSLEIYPKGLKQWLLIAVWQPVWRGFALDREEAGASSDPYDLSEVLVFEKQVPIGKATIKNQKKQRLIEIERTAPTKPIVESGISFPSLLRQEHRQQRQREITSISFRQVEAEREKRLNPELSRGILWIHTHSIRS
ncbi:MAG: hypothetical protein U0931_37125 [Vulcanimicrobiota bacterium]